MAVKFWTFGKEVNWKVGSEHMLSITPVGEQEQPVATYIVKAKEKRDDGKIWYGLERKDSQ